MEEDHTVKFAALYDGPPSALGWVHFVVAVPGPFNGWMSISHPLSAVHVAVDVTEVELPTAFVIELKISFLFLVNEVLVPGAHRVNSPAAYEGVYGFCLLCHCLSTVADCFRKIVVAPHTTAVILRASTITLQAGRVLAGHDGLHAPRHALHHAPSQRSQRGRVLECLPGLGCVVVGRHFCRHSFLVDLSCGTELAKIVGITTRPSRR